MSDTRRETGEYYPGGAGAPKIESPQGVCHDVTMPEAPTQRQLADTLKTVVRKLGGTVAALALCFCVSAAEVTSETEWQDVPPNKKIGEIVNPIVTAATNGLAVSIEEKADKLNIRRCALREGLCLYSSKSISELSYDDFETGTATLHDSERGWLVYGVDFLLRRTAQLMMPNAPPKRLYVEYGSERFFLDEFASSEETVEMSIERLSRISMGKLDLEAFRKYRLEHDLSITNLVNDIAIEFYGELDRKADAYHHHPILSVEGLKDALDTKANTDDIPNYVGVGIHADINSPNGFIPSVIADAVADKADKEEVRNIYNFVTGTGVWFSVTNYMRTTSAIPTMSLYEIDNGTNKLVWSQVEGMAKSFDDSKDYTDAAIRAADVPDKAWSLYTSGLGLPAPSNTTWVSTPQTVLAGGLEYARTETAHGSYWFLVSNGMVAQVADTNGFLRIVDDSGESGFTIRKTDSYTVGAAIDSIEVMTVNGYNHVRLTFPVVSDAHPILEASPTLSPSAWSTDIDATVTWSGVSGAWVADVDLQSQYDQHYFKASVTVQGQSVVEMDKPLSAASGILCTDGIHKVRPVWHEGNTITWEVVP